VLAGLFKRRNTGITAAESLYLSAVDAARRPVLFDFMFVDFDNTLREAGVGDLGVGRRVKQMATGFYGRIAAYDAGLDGGDLNEALRRNAYGTVAVDGRALARLGTYLRDADQALAGQSTDGFLAGRVTFPDIA
jgi:cytochrome b pre-mRNA-processing protein 3